VHCGHEFDLLETRNAIGHMTIRFQIGHFLSVVIWNSVYLNPFSRHWGLNIMGSPVWPFGVTWPHLIPHMPLPIGGPLEESLYL